MNGYSCAFCKSDFISQNELLQHQKVVHDMFSPSVVREIKDSDKVKLANAKGEIE